MIQPDIRLLARLSCHGNDRANAGVAGVKRVENPLDRVGKLLILARLVRSNLAHVTSGHSQHLMGNTGERSFPMLTGRPWDTRSNEHMWAGSSKPFRSACPGMPAGGHTEVTVESVRLRVSRVL
jgi:hypothetical protein